MSNVIPFAKSPTRCEKLFNPMSIRKSKTPWIGEVTPGEDEEFCQFESFIYGIRAGCLILLSYYNRHGLFTIRKIINRWAPPSENDTSSYQACVADDIGIGLDDSINLSDINSLISLAKAIVRHEQGRVLPSEDNIYEGAILAVRVSK